MPAREERLRIWALGQGVEPSLLERLGDARALADAAGERVGALVLGAPEEEAAHLFPHGADAVLFSARSPGPCSRAATAEAELPRRGAGVVFAGGDVAGREWAALLAARLGWRLVSPALMVEPRAGGLEVTALGEGGRMARRIRLRADEPVVLTQRAGVAEALPADPERRGTPVAIEVAEIAEGASVRDVVAADPAAVDIRDAPRLVAGGRGVGGREGFERLKRFAARLGAGVAASRVAVDLGWIDRERQVGQTGRTVAPDLYVACGISGASHHLEGMSGARHIVAVNTDPEAPIFKIAHLGLVADLHEVLERAQEILAEP